MRVCMPGVRANGRLWPRLVHTHTRLNYFRGLSHTHTHTHCTHEQTQLNSTFVHSAPPPSPAHTHTHTHTKRAPLLTAVGSSEWLQSAALPPAVDEPQPIAVAPAAALYANVHRRDRAGMHTGWCLLPNCCQTCSSTYMLRGDQQVGACCLQQCTYKQQHYSGASAPTWLPTMCSCNIHCCGMPHATSPFKAGTISQPPTPPP
jgi:hypothetical protein